MAQNLHPKTHGKIMHRVPKTNTNIYGVSRVSKIPIDKVCVVAFGGERTKMIRTANWYASLLDRLVAFYDINDVNIYSVYYNFEKKSTDRKAERTNAFIRARSKILNQLGQEQPVNTNYVRELYDALITPRIVGPNGKKLPDDAALQNIRNLILYTHCHGSTTVHAFQDMMARDMRELGYTTNAARTIMKNLLVVQHAPVSPLEKSKFNTVSFMSANDTQMNFHNKFSEYVSKHNEDLLPSYFPLGNFFAVHAFTYQYIDEHQIIGLVPVEDQDMLTPDGATIMAAERNTILNGIRAAQTGAKMPDIRELVAPISQKDAIKPDFDTLSQNGEFFILLMRHDLRIERENSR